MRNQLVFVAFLVISLFLIGCKPSEQEPIANVSKLSPEVLEAIKNESIDRIPVAIEVNNATPETFNRLTEFQKNALNTTMTLVRESVYIASVDKASLLKILNLEETEKIRSIKREEKVSKALERFIESSEQSDNATRDIYLTCFPHITKSDCESQISSLFIAYQPDGPGFRGTTSKENLSRLGEKNAVWHIEAFMPSSPPEHTITYYEVNDKK